MLALVLMLASSRFPRTTQRRKHKHKHKSTIYEYDFHSLIVASLRSTYKLGRRKNEHKRKERKLKNSEKLSPYILVRHVGIKSRAKRQSGRAIVPNFYASALAYVMLMPITCVSILMLASYV